MNFIYSLQIFEVSFEVTFIYKWGLIFECLHVYSDERSWYARTITVSGLAVNFLISMLCVLPVLSYILTRLQTPEAEVHGWMFKTLLQQLQ